MCCTPEVRDLLQIENWICVAHWKLNMYSTLKMSPRPFPLLRISSLFHLLRIATAAAACSELSTRQKKQVTQKMSTKSLDSQKFHPNYQPFASSFSSAQCRCYKKPIVSWLEVWTLGDIQFGVCQVQFLFCDYVMFWIQLNEIDTAIFEKSGQSSRTIVNIESSHLLDWYSFSSYCATDCFAINWGATD